MTRFLSILLGCVLAACCASQKPIVTNAEVIAVKQTYAEAFEAESAYAALPSCNVVVASACAYSSVAERIKRADYDAMAAIVTADQERTAGAMAKARLKVDAFKAAADQR